MKNIEDILVSLGIDVPEDKAAELTKLVAENYKTINEHNKRVEALEKERDDAQQMYETAKTTISEFEKMDVEGVKKELEDYKEKVAAMEADHKKALEERDFNDALSKDIAKIKFSSEAAKTSVIAEVKAAGLKAVDGKIMGLNDFIASYKEKDASAFVDEQTENLQNNKASFTRPINNNITENKATTAEQIRAAMGLKPEKGE
ncbi:MAG: phage scaffolding protein [Lachnospiraceae bacterium]|nr:phage scaffolding protein [Lachnospiraceae bacterium]